MRFAFGPFLLDAARGTLTRDGVPLTPGQRAISILHALLAARGETVIKGQLMELAWPGLVVEDSNLSVQIAALRKLLGPSPDGTDWIVTVPRVGYRLPGATAIDEAADAAAADGERAGGRPSIAVLPFANRSDDATQDYFADGVTEDIIAALIRFRWFTVASRNSSFVYKNRRVDPKTAAHELNVRYLLVGAVRKSSERVRIAVELVEAHSRNCVWAEHYDFGLSDVFTVQDTIAQQVAGAIEPELLKSEGGQAAARRRSGSVSGWDLVARGTWFFHQVTQPTHLRARDLFRQACQVDPELVEARLWLGRVSAGLVAYGWSESPADDLKEGMDAALQAVQMDDKSPYAHYALAIVGTYNESFALALRAAVKAIELSPSFALGHLVLGMTSLFSGDAPRAVESLRRGLELNRYDPQNFVWHNVLALACLFSNDPQAGLQQAVESLKLRPTARASMETAAACCAALDQFAAAREWLQQSLQLPETSKHVLQPLWRNNAAWAKELRRLLAQGAS